MSERLLDKLYIGIDLKEESAMLSYFHPGMERPATVSFVAVSYTHLKLSDSREPLSGLINTRNDIHFNAFYDL